MTETRGAPGDPRWRALLGLACACGPLLFVIPLRFAIVGLPLVAYFPAIAVATALAGRAAGAAVLAAAIAAAVALTSEPPLDFTLGQSLNGYIFLGGFALSGLVVYLIACGWRRAGGGGTTPALLLSGPLSRWLARNARAIAALASPAAEHDAERVARVARERLAMAARVEELLNSSIASPGADLSAVMTGICQELARAENRADLAGSITVAPMALEVADFLRVCLIMADLLFLALREHPPGGQPLEVALDVAAGEVTLSVRWRRPAPPSWSVEAHRSITASVAGRIARVLGGQLHFSDPDAPGPAWAAARFPVPAGPAGGLRRWLTGR
ncbi:hypothetical protein ACFFJB_14100 [Camelimonas abortus]|uniref:Two-component sensor histidine kinase n=1 Tax=Camelimonas abortus TaxID=1017184 RepID=A0ABV7LFT1_9HYPH